MSIPPIDNPFSFIRNWSIFEMNSRAIADLTYSLFRQRFCSFSAKSRKVCDSEAIRSTSSMNFSTIVASCSSVSCVDVFCAETGSREIEMKRSAILAARNAFLFIERPLFSTRLNAYLLFSGIYIIFYFLYKIEKKRFLDRLSSIF